MSTCQCSAARTQGLARVTSEDGRYALLELLVAAWSCRVCVASKTQALTRHIRGSCQKHRQPNAPAAKHSPTTFLAAAKASAALHSCKGAPHSVTMTGAGGEEAERLMEDKMKSRAGPREGSAWSGIECMKIENGIRHVRAMKRSVTTCTCASHAE